MRLIDADALIEKFGGWYVDECTESGFIGTLKDILATEPTIQPEKAQLSCEGTTSDTISKTETVERLRGVVEVTVPITDYDGGYIDGIEFGISAVSTMPTIQPERKKGEWVQIQRCKGDTQPDLECPFCKHKIGWWDMGRYCAGCGAKLKGGAE